MNLEKLQNQTLLFLGKPRAFSMEEFDAQLLVHNIATAKELREDISYILEGRMMTPYEQNLSDALYEKGGYEFLNIDDFEAALAKEIDDNVLLMSLKLSGDKERLKSFLQNSCVSDALFFKLLAMYKWGREDFFENDDNRDVTAALIGRFYEKIERNHNVQYATTGLIHLVAQTANPQLLEAIANLEPLQYHPKIAIMLARHPQTPKSVLLRFLREDDEALLEALSTNSALDATLFEALLGKGEKYAKLLAHNTALTQEHFELLEEYAQELAYNPTLSDSMQQRLIKTGDEAIWQALATNSSLTQKSIELLLQKENESLKELLLSNANISEDLLREASKDPKNSLALAHNRATPKDIFELLYESGDEAVLAAMAKNEATPIDLLYQLQLDSRFARSVETNAAYGRHIQSQNIGWLV